MAAVVLSLADRARGPNTGTIAKPTRRDQQDLSAKFAEFTPAKLGAILRQTERGIISDWADLCDRMAIDAEVKASIESRLAAISGSRWTIEAALSGDPARDRWSDDAAAFVDRVFRNIPDFEQTVQDLLVGVGNGLGVAETQWTYDGGTWFPAPAWVHTRRFRFSPTWEPRLVDTGEQLVADGLPLEPGKWIVHSPRPIAGYPTMTGAMRTVCWPYLFKRWCQQFWLQGAERFAWPFMYAKVPRDAASEVRAKALAGLEALSADHSAVVEDPVAFELIESTTKDAGTWQQFHSAMNAEIAKGILGMTDATAPGKNGAYGAVESRKGISVDPRQALDERSIAATIRRDLTHWVLYYNRHLFGGQMPPVPHIRWEIASKRIAGAVDVKTLVEVASAVKDGTLDRASAIAILASQGMSAVDAGRIVGVAPGSDTA